MKSSLSNPVTDAGFDMKKPVVKVITILIINELLFIILMKVLLKLLDHQDNELIYYSNINIYFLIAILCWMNLFYSKNNKIFVILFGLWATILTPYTILFIFWVNFSPLFNYINYHIFDIFSMTFRLFITIYLFLWSIKPIQSIKRNLIYSALLASIVSIFNFSPIFISGEYRESYVPLFTRGYNLQIFNFALLIIFWHQYTKTRIILSEYLSSIISVYTTIIGLEIFHNFSFQNDLIFHHFSQYFMFILYVIIATLFFLRLIYLNNPESKINENYIENYDMLKGLINKPRKGLIIEFYSNINRMTLGIILLILIILGIYLFFFDKFLVFIRLNVLLLMISVIVSITLAIITWHKRWYDAIGIFFRKNRFK